MGRVAAYRRVLLLRAWAFEGSGFAQHFAGCLPRVLRELSYMSRALGWQRGGPERLALRDLLGSHARK